MKCPAIKILDHYVTWLGLQVHACWCQVSARAELLRVGHVNLRSVAGKFRLRTGEFKTARFPNNTTASIATHEPFTFKRGGTRLNKDPIRGLMKVRNGNPA